MHAAPHASEASIYRKYQNTDSISMYRIACGNIEIFGYTGIDLLIYHLAEFSRLVSRSREIFTETFTETFTFTVKVSMKVSIKISRLFDTTRKNSARESLNFSLRKFRKILHYYLLVRVSKAVISRRGPCLSSIR